MLRTYINMTEIRETQTQYATSWEMGRPPSPLELYSAAIFGDRRALSVTSEEIRDLQRIADAWEILPDDLQVEVDAFAYSLDAFMTFYQDRLQ